MNAPRIWIIIIFVITSMNTILGQSIIKLPNGKYASEGKELAEWHFANMLAENPEAYQLYNKYRNRENKSSCRRRAGVGLFLGGAVLTMVGVIGSLPGRLDGAEIYFVSGVIIGTTGLGFITASMWPREHLLTKAIDIYNNQLPATSMTESISFGMAQNGIGLVYNF